MCVSFGEAEGEGKQCHDGVTTAPRFREQGIAELMTYPPTPALSTRSAAAAAAARGFSP